MNHVVSCVWPEGPIARPRFLYRAISAGDERFKVRIVFKICERKVVVRKHYRGTAMDHIVNDHFAISESIAEWLDFVCRAQCEIVICQHHTDTRAIAKQRQKIRNIKPRADIKIWLIKTKEPFEYITTRPVCYIQILCHGRIV